MISLLLPMFMRLISGDKCILIGGNMQKEVTLNPGDSERVSFTIAPSIEGEYTIQLNGLTGLLNATAALEAEFEISGLSTAPAEIHVGFAVEIKAVVTNIGNTAGSYTVVCGVAPDTYSPTGDMQKQVTLNPGESQEVSFTIIPHTEGEYTIQLNGLTGLFNASVPAAEFEVSDLSIIPPEMNVGDSAEISALVTNIGNALGKYTVICDITPATYTPLGAVSATTIPLNDIINMMILMLFMTMGVKMIGRA